MFIMIPFLPGSRKHVVYLRETSCSRDPHDSRRALHLRTIIAPSWARYIRTSHRYLTYGAVDVPNHTSAAETTACLLLAPSLPQTFLLRWHLDSNPATCRPAQTY